MFSTQKWREIITILLWQIQLHQLNQKVEMDPSGAIGAMIFKVSQFSISSQELKVNYKKNKNWKTW